MIKGSVKICAVFLLLAFISSFALADVYELKSPSGRISAVISIDTSLGVELHFDGKSISSISNISMVTDTKGTLGKSPEVIGNERRSVDRVLKPEVRVKSETIDERYNELTLEMKAGYKLVFRLFDDSFAYRFETSFAGRFRIVDETSVFSFPAESKVYYPTEESFLTHSERFYEFLEAGTIPSGKMCSLPALFVIPDSPKVAILEADLIDYPGMYLEGDDEGALQSLFPQFALEEEQTRDRTVKVSKRAKYLAEVEGTRSYPWRVMVFAEKDADLIMNQSVYLLATPSKIKDTSWIRPGKVAWDWWNANNIYGVPFKAGINTSTYKYYIDFASRYGLEYIILDEGWSAPADLFKMNPDIDMDELARYADEKKVGLILWMVWKALDDRLDEALDKFQEWGVKGIKVDFMQRDDQWMVNYYWRVAEAAAKRKMLVDFHGSYKPAGLRRTYPNVITREGLKGLENYKWSDNPSPEHNLILPFTRMLAGPMDYTPGAMVNAQRENFKAVFNRPMSLGTRCHQLAMYVIYESPLQMLADSPSNYQREPECMEFLSKVPSTWDETRVLKAKVGDYIILARRKGETWYVGGMADEEARAFNVKLDFLDKASYSMTIYQDGANADRFGNDFSKLEANATKGTEVAVEMVKAGGFVIVLEKKLFM